MHGIDKTMGIEQRRFLRTSILLCAFALIFVGGSASGETFDKFLLQFQPEVATRARGLIEMTGVSASFEIRSIHERKMSTSTTRFELHSESLRLEISALGEVRSIFCTKSDESPSATTKRCQEFSLDDVCAIAERVRAFLQPAGSHCDWRVYEGFSAWSSDWHETNVFEIAQWIRIGDIATFGALKFSLDPCTGNITSLSHPHTRYPTGKEILISRDEAAAFIKKHWDRLTWAKFDTDGAPLTISMMPRNKSDFWHGVSGEPDLRQRSKVDKGQPREFDEEMRFAYRVEGRYVKLFPPLISKLTLYVDAVTGDVWQ